MGKQAKINQPKGGAKGGAGTKIQKVKNPVFQKTKGAGPKTNVLGGKKKPNTIPVAQPPQKPAPKQQAPGAKKAAAKKQKVAKQKSNLKEIGTYFGKNFKSNAPLKKITKNKNAGNVTQRIFDKNNNLKKDKAINDNYRAAWKNQDELFSTATFREVVKAVEKQNPFKNMSPNEQKALEEHYQIASQARIPTEYSGFATKNEAMQHPTSDGKALFKPNLSTQSMHAKLDIERKAYVDNAMKRVVDNKGTALEVVTEGTKASIEFTLNYFTAPITADNVFDYTQAKIDNVGKNILHEQVQSREAMKNLYEQLGGKLRPANKGEKKDQALKRHWDNSREQSGAAKQRAPSPKRM